MDKPAEIPAANTPAKPAPKPLLVIFDGNALVHRAYHAMPPLTIKKTGEMVGAVYGFVQILLKTIGDLKPTHYAIAFDKKGPTFRHRMYDQYKAQRPHMTDELAAQLGRVRQIVEAFHMPVYELDEYEADDVLGTLSRQASQLEVDTIIVTGDNDAMQLVGPRVRVLTPKHTFNETVLYDEAAVMEKFGVLPGQIADYKGLVGDTSDNIPGVPGVGEKTAARLLHLFGSLEEIYSRLDEVPPPRVQNILRLNQAVARQSKELATIVTHAPVQLDLDDCHLANYDRNKVSELFRELEFYSLVNEGGVVSGRTVKLHEYVRWFAYASPAFTATVSVSPSW